MRKTHNVCRCFAVYPFYVRHAERGGTTVAKPKEKRLGRITTLIVTPEHRDKLKEYTRGQGGHQTLCERVDDSIREIDGKLVARVYDNDFERIQKMVERPDTGGWQGLFREIMEENGKLVKP